MGLGGVAIAVPPYVIHPQTAVLGRAGGGKKETCIYILFIAVFTHYCFKILQGFKYRRRCRRILCSVNNIVGH